MCPWVGQGFCPESAPRGSGSRPDVIAAFNRSHSIEALLIAHGYTQRGKRWISPASSSGLAGVVMLDDRVYSHHGADPLADGHSHDTFDVYRILDHGGNWRAAVKEAATLLQLDARRAETPAKCEEKPGEAEDGGPNNSLANVLEQLRALHKGDGIKDGDWQRIVYEAGLAAHDVDAALTFLVEECEVGKKRPLLQDWKAYRAREDYRRRCERAERTLSREAGERVLIECDKTNIDNLTYRVESAMLKRPGRWELLVCGGIYMRVAKGRPIHTHAIDEPEVPAPPCVILKPYTAASMLRRIEQSVALFHPATETKPQTAAEVPHRLVTSLLDAAQPYAPETIGLVTHPIVNADGRLLSRSGLDARTRLYVQVAEDWDVCVDTQEEAARHLAYVKKALFGEFEFCTPLDADVAVSMLFTGVERKAMDQAPGYLAHANQQSSGKTALARFVHVAITAYDMAASTLSSDQVEAKKEILAQLLESPMMVCFDNIADGQHVLPPGAREGPHSPVSHRPPVRFFQERDRLDRHPVHLDGEQYHARSGSGLAPSLLRPQATDQGALVSAPTSGALRQEHQMRGLARRPRDTPWLSQRRSAGHGLGALPFLRLEHAGASAHSLGRRAGCSG